MDSKTADPYKAKNLNKDISLEDKINGLLAFIKESKFGMMTTRDSSTGMLYSRCMAVAETEQSIDLIFHTNTHTGKAEELAKDPHINISFVKSSGEWASVSGTAEVDADTETVKKYYTSALKAWVGDLGDGVHDGTAKDPRLGIIKVKTISSTYAVNQKTALGRGYEVAKGALTGNVADVNDLREISATEVQTWRTSKEMVKK